MINIFLLLSLFTLTACHSAGGGASGAGGEYGSGSSEGGGSGSSSEGGESGIGATESVRMLARVDKLGDKLEVTVLESEYTFGPHLVITTEDTGYYTSSGAPITREDIKVGDRVEILYSGQVMLSMPPQIVAHRITLR